MVVCLLLVAGLVGVVLSLGNTNDVGPSFTHFIEVLLGLVLSLASLAGVAYIGGAFFALSHRARWVIVALTAVTAITAVGVAASVIESHH